MQGHSNNKKPVIIESDVWRVALEPQMGLQTHSCKFLHNGSWLDLMPDCGLPDATLSASNFHMLPYSNRIRDGQFSHAGAHFELDNGAEHAIHGALRHLPWRVIEQSQSSIAAEYDSSVDGAVNWPWPIKARITYTIKANELVSAMTLTNLGDKSMPAGMGWHPYFSREINGAAPALSIPVSGVYPDTNGNCLPTGKAISLPNELVFTELRALDPNQRIDHCLSSFKAPAILAWPDAGITLKIHASSNCAHLVLFNPDKPYFAVEPVTNANDGFNLTAQGVSAGVVELNAGETLQAQMRLELGLNA